MEISFTTIATTFNLIGIFVNYVEAIQKSVINPSCCWPNYGMHIGHSHRGSLPNKPRYSNNLERTHGIALLASGAHGKQNRKSLLRWPSPEPTQENIGHPFWSTALTTGTNWLYSMLPSFPRVWPPKSNVFPFGVSQPQMYNILQTNIQHPTNENRKISNDYWYAPKEEKKKDDMSSLFSNYLRMDEIYSYLNNISMFHRQLVSVKSVGTTYFGNDISLVRISIPSPDPKPAIWIDAGIHAREWISVSTALFIIQKLLGDYLSDPTAAMIADFDWYILPVVNPDGYKYTWTHDRMWRKNRTPNWNSQCQGVDLNRNFEFYFGGRGSHSNPCHEKYRGPRAFSESETVAIRNVTKKLASRLQLFLSLHSFDQMWMVPYGPTWWPPRNYNEMISMAKIATKSLKSLYGTTYSVGPISKLSGFVGGGSVDWASYALGVKYAFAVELRDKGKYGFDLPADQIIPTGLETFQALRAVIRQMRKGSINYNNPSNDR